MDFLIRDKFLTKADVKDVDFGSDPEFIDYAKVYEARSPILEKAVKAILADKKEAKKFEAFKTKNANWLADYAEFMAIKEHFDNKALQEWDDKKAVKRDKATLDKLRKELAEVITYHEVVQYLFFSQWAELKLMPMRMVFKLSVTCQFTSQLIALKFGHNHISSN